MLSTQDIFDKLPSPLQEDYLSQANQDRQKALSILQDELDIQEWRFKCDWVLWPPNMTTVESQKAKGAR